ncbi:MAG: hypothetical protein ACI9OH_000032 [Oleispira sp.]|jgi:hypothetical protein
MKKFYWANAVFAASLLTACGGGGEETSADNSATQDVKTLSGNVNGLSTNGAVYITASGGGELYTQRLDDKGNYTFDELAPDTQYSLKVQAKGYRQNTSLSSKPSKVAQNVSVEAQPTPEIDNVFQYAWQDDGESVSGLEYASAVNSPIEVTVEGIEHLVPNIGAAQMLYRDYRIVLDDSGSLPWTQAHAYRLLETMKQIPQAHCKDNIETIGLPCDPINNNIADSVWTLTNAAIVGDISVVGKNVVVDAQAFSYAEPKIVSLEGQRGRFYSKRLHHAAVSYITDGGKDLNAANRILEKRFGVSIDTGASAYHSQYQNAVIAEDRHESAWQKFTPEEILIVINQFEEMPEGLHTIRDKNDATKGLTHLFRRDNAHDHPLYPDAPAVAWPDNGYIEFMEKAFKGNNLEHMQRLVLHEKTHFLWHYVLNRDLKLEWLALSDWYRIDGANPQYHLEDQPYSADANYAAAHTHGSEFNADNKTTNVDAGDGWSARKTTNFVSGYAQLKNPNEDLAESVSYFLNNPNKLRSRAPNKYNFIRDRLMAGVTYLQTIRDDLTFEVLNLYPDYVYPGKIKNVEIKVEGGAGEDKRVTIDLKLHTTQENCTLESCLEGASSAFTRIFSEIDTFQDIHFYPVNENGQRSKISDRLRATFTLPETAKNGWWAPAQITITDPLGNQRYQRSTDYGWQMFINNPAEDVVPPQYIAESLTLDLSDVEYIEVRNGDKQRTLENCDAAGDVDCRAIRTLTARWDLDEDVAMKSDGACFSRFAHQSFESYSDDVYGSFAENKAGIVDGQCTVSLTTTEYYRSGEYRVGHLSMQDRALNRRSENFSDNHPTREASPKVALVNDAATVDTGMPEMNIQRCTGAVNEQCISVTAEATNSVLPNGETNVVINYWARDDKAGLGTVSYKLRDPQGIEHFYYHQHENSQTLFFNGEATEWKQYSATVTLPVGSAPGTWGIASMTLHDKAGNRQFYDFTETLIFEPFEVE